MKKSILIYLLLAVGLTPSAWSQSESEALVVFYRENNAFGSSVSYPIFMNDSLVVTLKNASFTEYLCTPGEYSVRVEDSNGLPLRLTVEANETYFFRAGIAADTQQGAYEIVLVDRTSAEESLLSGKLKKQKLDSEPYVRPKNRIGLGANMGFGFKNHDMIKVEEGGYSTLSFGGGIGISVLYGRELSDKFDLSFELGYKMSELSPYLWNAKMEFRRGIVSVTPAYVIKLKGRSRLRLGAGPDCYFANTMRTETSEIMGGFNDKWKYSTAIGFHASAVCSFHFTDLITWDIGLKYYNVSYKYNSSEVGYYPLPGSVFEKGNGSGIDLILRIYYPL